MICDAATKPGESCHPLRAYGQYSMAPDDSFAHKDRNLHAWPPHKGSPPTNQKNCTKHSGTWAAHVINDVSERTTTNANAKKQVLPNACTKAPYVGDFASASGEGKDKKTCRADGGSWAKVDSNPGTCGTACKFECRMPCCLSIYEDGPPMYTGDRDVDKSPGGTNDLVPVDDEEKKGPLYEFLGKRPVCSRANPCEPKFACLGGDVCLEGYVKYYEPYVQKDGEYVCQNFHYKLPGKCPSPVVTWGPINGWSEFDDDFQAKETPNFHAYLISSAFAETTQTASGNASFSGENLIEGSFDFQVLSPTKDDYREKWCDDLDNDQHCFWGTPVKVLGYAQDPYEAPELINPDEWKVMTKKTIKSMNFRSNRTKTSLLDSQRTLKTLKAEPLDKLVKIQMYDKKFKVVPAHLLITIRYPSLRLSGVPDSIDPEGGHAEWCSEHPARCYFERNPHPKGEYDKQRIFRPQSQICCFAPKCTECDPSTHFRMEENCIACPKCWWCIPVIIV